jgi:hypothetical protein
VIIDVQEISEAIGHVQGEWIVDKPAEVGVEGSQHKECIMCGELLGTEVIEALPNTSQQPTESETLEETAQLQGSEEVTTDNAEHTIDTPDNSGGCTSFVNIVPIMWITSISAVFVLRRKKRI